MSAFKILKKDTAALQKWLGQAHHPFPWVLGADGHEVLRSSSGAFEPSKYDHLPVVTVHMS